MKNKIRSLTYDSESRALEFTLVDGARIRSEEWKNGEIMDVDVEVVVDDEQSIPTIHAQFVFTLVINAGPSQEIFTYISPDHVDVKPNGTDR